METTWKKHIYKGNKTQFSAENSVGKTQLSAEKESSHSISGWLPFWQR